jgi:serine/threonine-protein kinase ATR
VAAIGDDVNIVGMRRIVSAGFCVLTCVFLSLPATTARAAELPAAKPAFRDFMGLCTHTIQFKPDLYKPTCRLARDYHPLEWDLGNDTAFVTQFPFARNRVDWSQVYGSWKRAGFDTDISIQFGSITPKKWADLPRDAHAYGLAIAKALGPGNRALINSAEIGNEPGDYPDARYRTLFENMAKGLREGDSKLKIVTCAATAGKSGKYAKSLSCFDGLNSLYDVINVHTYAEVEGWPTWKRSFPEDQSIRFRADVKDVLAWRDAHAAGKRVWITEFGWDAASKPAPKTGDFAKWVGSTETEQARYIVRSFLVFSAMDIDRAYLYFFNDEDEPHVHGASGITRNFKPKPAYWAMAHLYVSLGDYRFDHVVTEKPGELYVYAFRHASDTSKQVWAAWSPTGINRSTEATIDLGAGVQIDHAERMALAEGKAPVVSLQSLGNGRFKLPIDESPVFIWSR